MINDHNWKSTEFCSESKQGFLKDYLFVFTLVACVFAFMYDCTPQFCRATRGQTRAPDPLKTGVTEVMSHSVGVRTKPRSSGKVTSPLNC